VELRVLRRMMREELHALVNDTDASARGRRDDPRVED
jgi:hypothetical protein